MGQIDNKKYHISDEGTIYRVNEDGSFTSVGNIEDIENKPSSTPVDKIPPIPTLPIEASKTSEVGWWKRNYNRLWVTTLVFFIGWFISCLSCSGYNDSFFGEVFKYCFIILLSLALSWFFSSRTKAIFKWLQIAIIIHAIWVAYTITWFLGPMYRFLALIPFSIWIGAVCLSVFKRRYYNSISHGSC